MKVILDLNPDECLALIQVLERDIVFRDLSERVIDDIERYRHEWANEVRNLGYLRGMEVTSEILNQHDHCVKRLDDCDLGAIEQGKSKIAEVTFKTPYPWKEIAKHWHAHMSHIAEKREIREAVANYMYSEGCSCCRDDEAHEEAKSWLARLLDVERYDDDSGWDFFQYINKENDNAS